MFKKLGDFLYNFFFVDSLNNKLSHTKFLSIVAGIVMIVMFPYAVIHGDKAGFDIWLMFGGLVFGARHLTLFLRQREQKKEG